VTQQPTHLVQTIIISAAPQPARRGKVSQRVRVKAPIRRQTGLRAQEVENLDEVPVLSGRPLGRRKGTPLTMARGGGRATP
jgi:hypothetical protein